MTTFLAALPILLVLVLMLGPRWSAARAGVVGAVVALATSVLGFGSLSPNGSGAGTLTGLVGIFSEAAFTAVTILWIIGPALGIHELQLRTGAADTLRGALASFAPDPRILALLVAWFFVLFMEGAAGFGASVALAAPFLVAAGFAPVPAVTITLIGHVVGVSFGAVGTPIVPQVAASGLSGLELSRATGVYHAVLGWLPLIVMLRLVGRESPQSDSRFSLWRWAAVAFLCFSVPYSLLWAFVGPELPTIGGALFGGMMFLAILRASRSEGGERGTGDQLRVSAATVARSSAPYLALVVLVLATRLLGPLREALRSVEVGWSLFDRFSGGIEPLYHPGTMLLLGFIAGAIAQRPRSSDLRAAIGDATRRLAPVAVALIAMLVLARTMVHAGMTEVLADAAAGTAGGAWPLLAPFVGVLGTFVTGSATASNILFSDFQRETALALGFPVARILGVQTFGASVGNMICPHNVIAAGATAGLAGAEGRILRRTLPVTLLYGVLGGILAWGLTARVAGEGSDRVTARERAGPTPAEPAYVAWQSSAEEASTNSGRVRFVDSEPGGGIDDR